MRKLFIVFFIAILVTSCIQKLKNIPPLASSKLQALYPKAENIRWDKENTNFEVNFKVNDVEMSIIFDAKGNLLETETEIERDSLPDAVKTALSKEFNGYEIREAARIVKDGKTTFESELKKGKSKLDAIFRPDGMLVKKIDKKKNNGQTERTGSAEKDEDKAVEFNEKSGNEEYRRQNFNVHKNALSSVGENPYFILNPGYQLTLQGEEDGKKVVLLITVLDETRMVDGVQTRIVEERESHNGALVEVSRNYYALDPMTKDVYYFGEAVDIYKDDLVVGHEGAWQSGKNGAHFGMMMPGQPQLEQKFYQEVAPETAMDRAEVESLNETLTTPGGTFTNCLKTKESTPLEPGIKEYKMYAPDVGIILDGSLKLVKYGNEK